LDRLGSLIERGPSNPGAVVNGSTEDKGYEDDPGEKRRLGVVKRPG
jgi:hypothetical protein